ALLLLALPLQGVRTNVNFWGEGWVIKGKITVSLSGPPAETADQTCDDTNSYCQSYYLYTPTNTVDVTPWSIYTISLTGPGCPSNQVRGFGFSANGCAIGISVISNWTDDQGDLFEKFMVTGSSNLVVFDICCLPAD